MGVFNMQAGPVVRLNKGLYALLRSWSEVVLPAIFNVYPRAAVR